MNADETWNRYCAKLEELRRQQDEARKRRKESPATVEVVNELRGVLETVPSPQADPAVGSPAEGGDGIPDPPPRP